MSSLRGCNLVETQIQMSKMSQVFKIVIAHNSKSTVISKEMFQIGEFPTDASWQKFYFFVATDVKLINGGIEF